MGTSVIVTYEGYSAHVSVTRTRAREIRQAMSAKLGVPFVAPFQWRREYASRFYSVKRLR